MGPIPSVNQMRWQEMEFYAFVHLSVNTYTDMAWGFGDEDPSMFNPEELDCRQWAKVCKGAGMKGIIITAKHHSGFCLWPSKYTEYSVKNAPWKNGKGDIVKELADACKEYGLKFGVYLSPWDRNHPDYGKPAYITYFRNQLTELLTNYGDVFEVWFDGANGGTGYYGGANENRTIDRTTYYDWENTYKLVRQLQPEIVIWNDGGDRADLRWVGTESGYVGETNWSLLNATGDVPEDMLRHGLENGDSWVPGEVNTSIRPEWFYHAKEDAKVKKLPQLMDIYHHSIGRNGTLLLNFPIMPNGLIHEYDIQSINELAGALKVAFEKNLTKKAKVSTSSFRSNQSNFDGMKTIDGQKNTYWAQDDGVTTASLTLQFSKKQTFNRFLVQEFIQLGQRVKAFTVEAWVDGKWKLLAKETTIGYKRILRLPTVSSSKIRLSILDSKACPLISNIEVYNAPQILAPPQIRRTRLGDVILKAADPESEIYYTLNGSQPKKGGLKYKGPIQTSNGKVNIKALAYDGQTGKVSSAGEEQFDISKQKWEITNIADTMAYRMLDGDFNTAWQGPNKSTFEVVINLNESIDLLGFKYLPPQHWWEEGNIITEYQTYQSTDGQNWRLIKEGEFANIKNNPVWQNILFEKPLTTKYLKFVSLKTVNVESRAACAEFDVITK